MLEEHASFLMQLQLGWHAGGHGLPHGCQQLSSKHWHLEQQHEGGKPSPAHHFGGQMLQPSRGWEAATCSSGTISCSVQNCALSTGVSGRQMELVVVGPPNGAPLLTTCSTAGVQVLPVASCSQLQLLQPVCQVVVQPQQPAIAGMASYAAWPVQQQPSPMDSAVSHRLSMHNSTTSTMTGCTVVECNSAWQQEQMLVGVQLTPTDICQSSSAFLSMRSSATTGPYQAVVPVAACCGSSQTSSRKRPASQLDSHPVAKYPRLSLSGVQLGTSVTPMAVTPCNLLIPSLCAPPAPRLLCRLSPASLQRCCKVATRSLSAAAEAPCRLTPPLMLRQEQRPLLSTRCSLRDMHEFFGAVMRLLGAQEPSTLRLAVHCWQRVQLQLLLTPSQCHQWQQEGGDGQLSLRAAMLCCAWVAGKCEEPRVYHSKASVVAALLPTTGQATNLAAMEIQVMKLLDWSPYRGFNFGI